MPNFFEPYWAQLSAVVWQWPWMFALLPLPLLVRLLSKKAAPQPDALRVPFFNELHSLQQVDANKISLHWVIIFISVFAWGFLITAAARPTWIGDPVPLPKEGRDLMLAVDISGSMDKRDMRVRGGYAPRIDAVKFVVGDFIERRESDRIGLILFGKQAYLQTPLTFDTNSVKVQLQEAQLGFAGNATAIGDAIGVAIKRLRDKPAESRVLVLLTDGANTYGSEPEDAAKIAAEANIRIHVVGVGDASRDFFGNVSDAEIDEPAMQAVTTATGGQYFRARNPAELKTIYEYIDQLEPIPEEQTFRPQKSLFHLPLAISLALASLILVLRAVPITRRRLLA